MTRKESIKLFLRKVIYTVVNRILSIIPKKKGLVLFTSWLGHKYLDNPKYVYEFFLEHTDYKPVWLTKEQVIYDSLKNQDKPVELFNSLKGIWLQIRAEAVFSTIQFADFNTWLLSRCLFIDLGHGHPIKDSGSFLSEGTYNLEIHRMLASKLYYYTIVAGNKTKNNYNIVPIPKDHIFISDFARNDVLIDKSLQVGKNEVIEAFKNGRKAIVYMPTQRSEGKVKMIMSEILPLAAIQDYCDANDCVFIIKKHFFHRNEKENFDEYPCILDVTNIEDIDPQVLLCQADMLISDYSACYIDYMLLKRPLIFFQYDLKEFKNSERTLFYNFEELDIAPVVYKKEKLLESIDVLFKNGDKWLNKRMKFAQENYFDNIEQRDGCKKVKEIFDGLYNKIFG